jgi:hypothetical protein
MRAIAATLLFTSLPIYAQERLLQPADLTARNTAATALQSGLDSLRTAGAEKGGASLHAALVKARDCLPARSAALATLEAILQRSTRPELLAAAVAELVDDLTFQPVLEAKLPKDVPGFQALDELELREYPPYRLVRAEMSGSSTAAFWPLFNHIKSHDIAMTTPVQIDYRAEGDRQRRASMAFLYGSPDLGPLGRDGKVDVVDMPATTVITVGSRGLARPSRIAELRTRIEAWLAQSSEWEAAGPMRVMEYNSPFVRGDRRYFEVQIPVQARTTQAGNRPKA